MVGSDETVQMVVPGVAYAGMNFAGPDILPSKWSHACNSLVVTNRSFLFLLIPLPGAGYNVPEMGEIDTIESILNPDDIAESLKQQMASMTLPQLAGSNEKNVVIPFADVTQVSLPSIGRGNLQISTTDGKTRRYAVTHKDSLTALRQELPALGLNVR